MKSTFYSIPSPFVVISVRTEGKCVFSLLFYARIDLNTSTGLSLAFLVE